MVSEWRAQWAENIKAARQHFDNGDGSRGLSQRELARRLGIRVSSISRWENEVCAPTDDHKVALAHLFRVPVRVLFPLNGDSHE